MIMVFCKSVFFYYVPHESVLNSSVEGRIFVQVMVLASHRLVAQNYVENWQFIVLLLSLAPAMCNWFIIQKCLSFHKQLPLLYVCSILEVSMITFFVRSHHYQLDDVCCESKALGDQLQSGQLSSPLKGSAVKFSWHALNLSVQQTENPQACTAQAFFIKHMGCVFA